MPQLLSPGPSCGFRHGQRQLADLFSQREHHRPGFRDQAPPRQRVLAQPRHQPPPPALATHAHQPQAGRPPGPRARRAPARHIEPRAGGHRLVRFPPNAAQPQRRASHRQPPPRGAVGGPHPRAVPLPARALRALHALCDPGAPPIPAGIPGLGRHIGQEPPRVFLALLPAGQQRAGPRVARQGPAGAAPTRPRPWCTARQGPPTGRPRRPPAAARVEAHQRMPAHAGEAPNQPGRLQATVGQHAHRPARREAGCNRCSPRSHARRHACLAPAGRITPATGMAQPR
jgi:hypothetical protein